MGDDEAADAGAAAAFDLGTGPAGGPVAAERPASPNDRLADGLAAHLPPSERVSDPALSTPPIRPAPTGPAPAGPVPAPVPGPAPSPPHRTHLGRTHCKIECSVKESQMNAGKSVKGGRCKNLFTRYGLGAAAPTRPQAAATRRRPTPPPHAAGAYC